MANTRLKRARHGAVKPSGTHHVSAAHRRAAREFPTYDTSAIRPRHSKRKTALFTGVVVIVAALLAVGGFFAYSQFSQAPQVEVGTTVSVTVPEGASLPDIARKLKQVGVITDENAFRDAVTNRGVATQLKPGDYTLEAGMDITGKMDVLIDALLAGPLVVASGVDIVIPENFTVDLVAARVAKATSGRISAQAFTTEASAVDKYAKDYLFLEGVSSDSLEGFLFPKTYRIPNGSDAEYVVRMMLDQFEKETAGIDMGYARAQGLSFYDVVTIASLIEKEAMVDSAAGYDERTLVSSVIYNRLAKDHLLQLCSSVVYVLGTSRDYAAQPLTYDDIAVESPYNTYLHPGLPPGPICSPGLASLQAAARPAASDYFFFVLNPQTGHNDFSVTQGEHDEKVAVYGELNYRG